MNAIRFHAFGNADVLKYEKIEKPVLTGGEVLIRMKAAALNHLDVFIRSGEREKNIPLPHVPGSDGAGVIEEIGSSGTSFKKGDRVLISPGIGCGNCSFCLGGRENMCARYHVLGTLEDGTYAEYVKLPFRNILPMPEKMSFQEGAAFPLVFLTAWHMLIALAKIKEGETVLVHGGGSGVGTAAIQIVKLFKGRVITTAGSDEKLSLAKKLGADEVINYREKNFIEEARRMTDKQGVDVVFEHTGGEIFEKSIKIMKKGGRLVTCGSTTNYLATTDLRYLFSKQLTLYGSFMGTKEELVKTLYYYDLGILKPVIGSEFPLAKAADAHRRMEQRLNIGKIVLTI
ncbi:MAG: zinc-binding dehydrogenase [Bacteroidota bacterium]